MKSVLFLIFMGAVALALSSCASKFHYVGRCQSVAGDVLKCADYLGQGK
jgi:hypothetical protein